MVGNLDQRGYLCVEYEEVAESTGCTLTLVETVAEQLTTLEPHGVFARNLKECLLIQLDRLGKVEALEGAIVKNYLDRLQDKRYDQIAKKENVTLQDVYKAVQAIQKLEPYPGRPFFEDNTRYIIPDIYVQKVAGEFVVILNDDGLPKLRISRYYQQLLKEGGGSSSGGGDDKNRAYLQERLKAATWLIKSIQQRQNTIRKVAESIVKFQRDFLSEGISRLKPLVLKEVADDIGMHESTVSRVTSNKFMHTPQGLFELKFFFTTGIRSGEGEVSSSAIKEKIRSLIAQEIPEDPISDQKIVEILKQGQVMIARRTVAKYREALGIPASSQRKKIF
jgi:RNA polymerase sigma-54 factor